MTLGRTGNFPRRRYPKMTRMLSSLLLPVGWAWVVLPRLPALDFTSGWPSWAVPVVAVALLPIGLTLYILTIRSIPRDEDRHDSHLTCFWIPALVASVLLVMIASPICEMAAVTLEVSHSFDSLLLGQYGLLGVTPAVILGATLVGPLQFLWRDSRMASRFAWILLLVAIPLALVHRGVQTIHLVGALAWLEPRKRAVRGQRRMNLLSAPVH